jgi:serine/threonine protein kinase
MDFAEGGTLADKTPEGKYKYLPMKEDDVLQVVKETVNAFDFCHSKGIVHRDIKPGNLFYKNADGSDILVGDFGISSEVDLEGGMSKRMTTTSRTEGYAAPEIYSGVIGKEIDYYALGITVYELLTGKNPFAGRNDMHIMRDTIQGRVAEDLITRPEANSFSNRTKKLIQGLLTVRHEKRWGLLEVNRFLKGEDVPVAENLIKEIPTFTFNSKKYTDYVELSLALQEDRESAKKMLYRGNITRWAEGFDNDFAIKIGDIVEDYSKPEEQEFGLIQLLFLLNPDRSCQLINGKNLRTIEELKSILLQEGISIIEDIKNEKSELHAWLSQNNLRDFSSVIKQQKKLKLSDNKFISNLQVSITESFQPPFEDISIYTLGDILKLDEKNRRKIFKWSLKKESYFSSWFEIKGDQKKYDIWWGKQIKQTFEHWEGLLSNNLKVYSDNNYYTDETLREHLNQLEEKELEKQRIEEERIREEQRAVEAREQIKEEEDRQKSREKWQRILVKSIITFIAFIFSGSWNKYDYIWKIILFICILICLEWGSEKDNLLIIIFKTFLIIVFALPFASSQQQYLPGMLGSIYFIYKIYVTWINSSEKK